MRKRPLIVLVVFILLTAGVAAVFHLRTRPLPFQPGAWAGGDPMFRFRMKDSLVGKYKAGELPTREAVDAALGPDDDRGDSPKYRYFRLMTWYGNPWYVRISFDEDGKVVQFRIAPD